MIKSVKVISFILILFSLGIMFYLNISSSYDISVQNEIIDNVFNMDVGDDGTSSDSSITYSSSNIVYEDYLGYIYIPRFNIKRLIKSGTDDSVLNGNYVGMHRLSGSLDSDDLIILAGHNISNVFSKLHSINIGDVVYINSRILSRKFVVYDKKVVNEYDGNYLYNNRFNELLLITCTKNSGERLIVFLKEEL